MKKIVITTLLAILFGTGFSQTKIKDLVKEGTKFTYTLAVGGEISDTFQYKIIKLNPELVIELSGLKETHPINYTITQSNFNNGENLFFLPAATADTIFDNALILFLSKQLYKNLTTENKTPVKINIILPGIEIELPPTVFDNSGLGKAETQIMINGKSNSFPFSRKYVSGREEHIDFITDADFPLIIDHVFNPSEMNGFEIQYQLIAIDN